MLYSLLLIPLVLGAYERQGSFQPKKGTKADTQNVGNCFEAEFDVTPSGKVGPWCNLMLLGPNSFRKLGVWFYPGQTRLHVRTRTTNNANPGCDPNIQLPIGKTTNVRISACGKTLVVTIGTKVTKCRLPGPLVNDNKNQDLWLSDKWHAQCKAKLGAVELFKSLAPVFADCAKLKTLYASKKSKLNGERNQAQKAIPVHQAAGKAHSANLTSIKKVRALANSLKTMSKKTVSALLKLLKKLEGEANGGLSSAKKGEAGARAVLARAKQHLKHLETHKVSCACAKLKSDHEKKINAKSTENVDIKKGKDATKKMMAMIDKQISMLNGQLKFVPSSPSWLASMMKGMFTDQIKRANQTKAALLARIKIFDAKFAANTAYITKHRKEIDDCHKKLVAMRAKLMEVFDEEDADILEMVEGMDYFEDLRSAEIWSDRINLDVYENEFLVEEENFATQQEVEGVETQQVSYGLIGGAGVLTSGLFYYAYQRKSS